MPTSFRVPSLEPRLVWNCSPLAVGLLLYSADHIPARPRPIYLRPDACARNLQARAAVSHSFLRYILHMHVCMRYNYGFCGTVATSSPLKSTQFLSPGAAPHGTLSVNDFLQKIRWSRHPSASNATTIKITTPAAIRSFSSTICASA